LFGGLNIGFSIIFMKMTVMQVNKPKMPLPVYLVGILGIIPLIAAIVGFVLIILGIAAYRNWKLIVIGAFGILWSVAVYGTLFYFGFYSKWGRSGFAKAAQQQLTDDARELEFYKIENGDYPDSLQQLYRYNTFVFIVNPTQFSFKNSIHYQYEHHGDHYTLFSVGIDGIAHTRDDIFPVIPPDTGRIHYGWIKE
jgi:Type II secretion system (T2SS), protein G